MVPLPTHSLIFGTIFQMAAKFQNVIYSMSEKGRGENIISFLGIIRSLEGRERGPHAAVGWAQLFFLVGLPRPL